MLTDAKLRILKPKAKLYRIADSAGLCIEVQPRGARYWRISYRFAGKRKMLSLSENTITAALRRLGYTGDEMTGHGFRSMASTLLHEQGWPSDVIERQLAHAERNKVKAAYNYAEHLPQRRNMMQAWSDYLDGLKAGGKIIPIKRSRV